MTNMKIQMTNHRGEDNRVQIVSFSRVDNGMIIGAAKADGYTQFGEDPSKLENRFFISFGHSIDYVKAKCREYCGREDVDFLVQEGDPLIQTASPGQMPHRRM